MRLLYHLFIKDASLGSGEAEQREKRRVFMEITLDLYQTTGLAMLLYALGSYLVKRSTSSAFAASPLPWWAVCCSPF